MQKTSRVAAGTAVWATNVGNERGEILQSILTSSESVAFLKKLAEGLMNRYEGAGQPPPLLLYTDRDCCCKTGLLKYQSLFNRWDDLLVRLHIWHFM